MRCVPAVMAVIAIVSCTADTPGEMMFDDGGTDPVSGSSGANEDTDGDSTVSGPACVNDEECLDAATPICDLASGTCVEGCIPGTTQPCYSGDPSTLGVGECREGINVCTPDAVWDPYCQGEVVPETETCDNGSDDDCDGVVDDADLDGDGFGICSGDCCDIEGGGCTGAHLVNPGAYDVPGNRLDDDCNGDIDDTVPTCDGSLDSGTSNALDFARAIDLCKTTEEDPNDREDLSWGVISAELTRADGHGVPLPVQHSLRSGFGDEIEPEAGARLAVLSTGHAADADDTDPDYAPFQGGINLGTSSPAPADWLEANRGQFPNPAGCLEPWNEEANDPVMLTLRLRAPTNAHSFSVMTAFYSAEYPEWVCSEFNDFFLALVDSVSTDNPGDKNIAIYDAGGESWPVGVNLVMVAGGLFSQCDDGPVGCASDLSTEYTGCTDAGPLAGTGFDQFDDGCDPGQPNAGGGTGWLRMSGNVQPGEVFELRFAVWDTSGHIFDSVVLLDGWEWSVEAAEPGVAPG